MTVRYPIAETAEGALRSALGRAARQSEASSLAGEAVEFARELIGPAFATREAAEAAYAGLIDTQGQPAVPPEERFCELMEVIEPKAGATAAGGQAEPVFAAGKRWPKPSRRLKTQWRLSVAYWRILGRPAGAEALPQAREARRAETSQRLDAEALRAMARQPLQPVKPQQPLDIGLFEVRPPEAPHIIMPDE